jgi:very-short-patch-repair endonuclease
MAVGVDESGEDEARDVHDLDTSAGLDGSGYQLAVLHPEIDLVARPGIGPRDMQDRRVRGELLVTHDAILASGQSMESRRCADTLATMWPFNAPNRPQRPIWTNERPHRRNQVTLDYLQVVLRTNSIHTLHIGLGAGLEGSAYFDSMNRLVLEALHDGGGVATRRSHPELASTLHRHAQRGELVAVLPGVFVASVAARDWRILALAACRWDQDAVLVAETAAALTFWPELKPATVQVANRRSRFHRPGFEVARRTIPSELVISQGALRLSDPSLTALDLIVSSGGDAIDRALRSRMVSLASMYHALALVPNRRGNEHKRRLLLDSRDEPWSAAERLAHQVFRSAGLRGWETNVAVRCGIRRYFLDIAFRGLRLAIEIDGREFHGPDTFEADRRRDADLLLAGWKVLHFTWRMLTDEPEWVVTTVKAALRLAA